MHEASLMAGLMRKIDEIGAQERARRIVGVSVWLGALSHMSAEHFTEHFTDAAAGTNAEGARLDIEVSADTDDANAQDILLKSVEVET
jgi:hydrogenase nickel incorporation protein HypA/HybF